MSLQERGLIRAITMLNLLNFGWSLPFEIYGFGSFHTLSGLVLDRYTQSH
jgi:hypothetical protein